MESKVYINNKIHSQKISKPDIGISVLIVLSFALLPIGRTVEIITILLTLVGLIVIARNQSSISFSDPSIRLFTLIFMMIWIPMLLSLIDSINITNSVLFTFKYLRFLIAGILTVYMLKSPVIKVWILYSLVVIVCFWLLDSLIQWVIGFDLLGRTYDGFRLTGPFKKLIMPVYLSVSLPLIWVWVGIKWNKYCSISFYILSVWVLLLTGSRASVLVLGMGCLLFLFYIFMNTKKKPWFSLVLSICLLTSITFIGYSQNSAFKARVNETGLIFTGDYQSINKATSYRLPIWEAAYNMASDNTLNGIGIKNFRQAYHHYDPPNNFFEGMQVFHPHLFFLEIFAETGIIGFTAMLLIPVVLYRFKIKYFLKLSLIQAIAIITILMIFFPFNSHVSLYAGVYSQVAWLMTAISCACLVDDTITKIDWILR